MTLTLTLKFNFRRDNTHTCHLLTNQNFIKLADRNSEFKSGCHSLSFLSFFIVLFFPMSLSLPFVNSVQLYIYLLICNKSTNHIKLNSTKSSNAVVVKEFRNQNCFYIFVTIDNI